MWVLTRLGQFHRAYRSAELTWDERSSNLGLHFLEGLLFALALVTPFWIAVGYLLHLLTN